MILEFAVGDDANLLEHELTRPGPGVLGWEPKVETVWRGPGVFRLVGPREELRRIVEERWAFLPGLPPARMILAE